MKGQRNLAPQSFWSMTSVALITALTVSPFFRPISSALRRVMTLSIWLLPTRTVMWAMTSPSWMLTIFPVSWFLAERGIRRHYPNLPEILGLAFASQCLLGGHSEYPSFPRSLLPVTLLIFAGLCSGQNTTAGRFIIVGMGTAPDLMTVRAQTPSPVRTSYSPRRGQFQQSGPNSPPERRFGSTRTASGTVTTRTPASSRWTIGRDVSTPMRN